MAWKFQNSSGESIKLPATSDNILNARLNYFNNPKFWVEFNGIFLKLDKVTFANWYITFEILSGQWFCVNGAVKLTKNLDPDKCSYSGYIILIDVLGTFSLLNEGFSKNIRTFGANVSSSVHVDDKKDNPILHKSPVQRLDYTTLTAEVKYSVNFTEQGKKFC